MHPGRAKAAETAPNLTPAPHRKQSHRQATPGRQSLPKYRLSRAGKMSRQPSTSSPQLLPASFQSPFSDALAGACRAYGAQGPALLGAGAGLPSARASVPCASVRWFSRAARSYFSKKPYAGTQPQPEYPRAFPPSQETSKHLSPAPRKWCQGRSGTAQQHRIAQHTSRSPTSASNVQSTRTQVGRIWSCPVVGMQPACSGYCGSQN